MTQEKQTDLREVRQKIDAIDSTILALLKERIGHARTIGALKDRSRRAKWDPVREREILARLAAENQGVFPDASLLGIFREIISTCRLSQEKTSVAYLGPEATFSHLAGIRCFGQDASYLPMESIEDVFIEVERERVGYGIVPVENSIEGAVTPTLDAFIRYRVKICGELNLPISHNLINQSGDISDIQQVASHPQPLGQCRQWLKKNLPGIPVRETSSTGAAAEMAAADPHVAAIASTLAVTTYHLQNVVKGIEDYRGNTTRFLMIGKESPGRSGRDKTSLLVGLLDRPGALNEALAILAERAINLTRIESRPVKDEPGRYLFFIDMLGHIEDEAIEQGCGRLREICSYFEWLGSYPASNQGYPIHP